MFGRERGFIILPLLMLVAFISVAFSFALSRINEQWSLNRSQRIRTDVKHLATTVSMIYSNRQSCLMNINSSDLGESVAQMQARSASGVLRLQVPENSALTIARNSLFSNLRITDVRLGAVDQPFPSEQAFLIPLNITVEVSGSQLRTVAIPFYFVSDGSGRIKDCYATFYTDVAMNTTLEDSICKQTSANNIFTAANQFCAPDPNPNSNPMPRAPTSAGGQTPLGTLFGPSSIFQGILGGSNGP